MKEYDLIIVGMGPSGVFCAYELIQKNKHKNILLIEQGHNIKNRNCPLEKVGKCVNCSQYVILLVVFQVLVHLVMENF